MTVENVNEVRKWQTSASLIAWAVTYQAVNTSHTVLDLTGNPYKPEFSFSTFLCFSGHNYYFKHDLIGLRQTVSILNALGRDI